MGRFIDEIMQKIELKIIKCDLCVADEELEELRYTLNQILRTRK